MVAVGVTGRAQRGWLRPPADETPMPGVRQSCAVCRVTLREIYDGNCIVSPSNIAHRSNGYESTFCGHDATGDNWWWPL